MIDPLTSQQANEITIESINQLNSAKQKKHEDPTTVSDPDSSSPLHNTRTYSISKSPLLKVVPPINFCPVERQLYRSGQPTAINHSFLRQLKIKNVVWLAAEDPNDDLLMFAEMNNIVVHYVGAMSKEPTASANAQNTSHGNCGASHSSRISNTTSTNNPRKKSTDGKITNVATASSHKHQQSINNSGNEDTDDDEEEEEEEDNEDDDYDNEKLDTTALTPWDGLSESTILQALSIITNKNNYPLLVCCGMGRHRTGTVIGCLRRLQGWNFASVSEEYRRFTGSKGGRILVELLIESFDIGNVKLDEKVVPSWLA